jgi:molybdopterin/thiamine biosynthesis adenylyltransferase
MITLVFLGTDRDRLRAALWDDAMESAAILLCEPVPLTGGDWRLLVRETHVAQATDYEERTTFAARLTAAFGLPFERKAKENRWSLVYCHTHPHQRGVARFSTVDDEAEIALSQYAGSRSPGVPHCALLFSAHSLAARPLGGQDTVRVMQVGSSMSEKAGSAAIDAHSVFDRQVRAFGEEGQRRIEGTRIAIVGLGGTGSVTAQQLAHLGARDFVLIDRDVIEETNLNRTVGSTAGDVGQPKVAVAQRLIESIRPESKVLAIVGDVVDGASARTLLEVDIIFCCTDSHASRHLINQLVYQYGIPAIDMGVAISAVPEQPVRFAGHVKALAPGLACLWCLNSLDSNQIRRELMSPEHRAADPYFNDGPGVPQPAVITLNSTVASLAGTMFLSMIAGVDAPARYLVYDGNRQRVAHVDVAALPNCSFCGLDSTAGAGDSAPLPVRAL